MTIQNPSTNKQEQQPLVSVIMNCYNSARYLREALDSVLAQTFNDWEIVFWDNQSTDDSAYIFKSYSDKRFRYFLAPEYTALGQARNLAVEQARGEWVAFLDCDDLWFPRKLEKQVAIIQEEGIGLGLVYGQCQILVQEGGLQTDLGRRMEASRQKRVKRRLPEGNIFPDLLKWNFVPLVSAVVRRSAYWSVGGIEPIFKLGEDYDLFIKISNIYTARAVQEIICSYRVHYLNQSHKTIDGYQELLKIVSRYLPMAEAKVGIRHHQICLAIEEIRQGFMLQGVMHLLRGDMLLFALKVAQFVWKR
ncbi:MAG TPA: glycosyltransferase family 2 protein [Candidatus Wunengus sp. YC65]|uniref:glycosyltransferase family 2 protein n=1 Tax=Candidatus Wunengus sp. YC65 TaxID=3367701 RepID=UPI004029EFBF